MVGRVRRASAGCRSFALPSSLGLPRCILLILLVFSTCVFCIGCADVAEDARSAQLQRLLTEDNRALLEREPYLTELKYQKMARSPYEFLRGTPFVYLFDLMQPGAWPTAYGSEESAYVLSMGDAHPENIGTYQREDGTLFLDYNDFDGVGWAPYHFEVRRLALTFSFLTYEIYGDDASRLATVSEQLARHVAESYVAAIDSLAAGFPPIEVRPGAPANEVSDDLFSRARRDGPSRAELVDYCELEDGEYRLRTGMLRFPDGDVLSRELWDVSASEYAMVASLLSQWPQTTAVSDAERLTHYELVDVRRRIGAGVSSYPLLRYYALLRGPGEDPDDVILLDIKESRDGPRYAGLIRYPLRAFTNNAERTVLLQRQFQEFEDADPLLGYVASGSMAFRVQDTSQFQKGVSIDRIIANLRAGDWSAQDLLGFAEISAAMLARSHGLALTAEGHVGVDVIHAALGGDASGFSDETWAFTDAYTQLIFDDYRRFQQILTEVGPLLGYRGGAQ